jgi:hypothetical protein
MRSAQNIIVSPMAPVKVNRYIALASGVWCRCKAGTSHTDMLFQTPSGINPGQSFRVVFPESIGDTATSSNIAGYHVAIISTFIIILDNCGVIGSRSIIGARPKADGAAALFENSLPVCDLRGTLLASTGGLYQSIGPSCSIDQSEALFLD